MNRDLWKMVSGLPLCGAPELPPNFGRFARDRSRDGVGKFLAIIHSAAEIP
jgi:hypothetical protein